MVLSEKLENLCRRSGLSRVDLMRLAGQAGGKAVSRSTVNNWIRGHYRPPLTVALHLARAFGVPLEYLADDSLDGPPPINGDAPPDELAAICLYRRARERLGAAETLAALAALAPAAARGGGAAVPPDSGAGTAPAAALPPRRAV